MKKNFKLFKSLETMVLHMITILKTTFFRLASQARSSFGVLSLAISGLLLIFYTSPLLSESPATHQLVNNSDKIVTDVKSIQAKSTKTKSTKTWPVPYEIKAQVLYAEQWELARSGDSVLSLPVLSQTVNTWLQANTEDKANANKIEIQYPGGEEGEIWVQQLTDWLVSLGIPSASMMLTPGSPANDIIKFDIIK